MPRWSPDGQRLAFLANAGTGTAMHLQLYVTPSRGGQPKSLTTTPRGVQQYAWSPDSKTIAFATQDEPEAKQGFERWNKSFEVTLSTDFTMTAAVPPTHVWMVPSGGGDMKRLTSGSWTLPISHPPGTPASFIVWTPDGSGVVFTRNGGGQPPTPLPTGTPAAPDSAARGRAATSGQGGQGAGRGAGQRGGGQGAGGFGGGGLQIVNVSDLSITPLGAGGNHPLYSPDGKSISTNNGSVTTLPTDPSQQGQTKNLTQALDRGIARALWMPDGKSIIVGANDTERVSLWQQPLDGAAKKIDTGDVSPNSSFFVDMSVSKEGAIAFSGTTPMRPVELYYMPSPTSPVQRLTDFNGQIAALPLGKSEVVEWTNDNFKENGILTYPPDFDPSQKYPLVLYIHGGPRAASMMTFSAQAQLMAAHGWLVFQPNYRGSDNLGGAYQGAIRNDAGEGPGRDVIAGIESLKKRGFVDDTRMGVSGWSYGGYMTTWMTGHYDIWKAAVTGASVTNQLDQYNFSDGAGGGRGNNSPWVSAEAMERMRAQSPITYANKVKAPTLILHDTGDYRVTITQSYEWFHALRDNGVVAQFIAYPVYGHSPTDPVHQRDVQRRWLEWFDQYLGLNTTGAGGKGR
jgi:dipeptidyl aminopeptidase/acylaminoacyl peptidase